MTFVRLIPAFVAFSIIAWFVSFQFNPYRWCDDHPDKPKTHFICEPFGFELEKGSWLERSPDHRFAGEDKIMHFKKVTPSKKTYNCQDANVLLTQEGYDYCMGKNK